MTVPSNDKSRKPCSDSIDDEIASFLVPDSQVNFFLFAGAGSGKTRTLVNALNHILENYGHDLWFNGHKVGVITYTNAACNEIKRRIGFSPLFQVSTIHSFAWELIKNFNNDIREWLRKNLAESIKDLKDKEAKGRGGNASISRLAKIDAKESRLSQLDSIISFTYNPNGQNLDRDSVNHSEVISICSDFLSENELMRWVLVGRFPFLLIDESQDTNKKLMDALLDVAKEHSNSFSIGLIGDVMQRIYADGKEKIESELSNDWAKPSKNVNYRCPKRVVRLINKVRKEVDDHVQEARSDAPEGYVRIFICSKNEENPYEIEDTIRHKMAEITGDVKWEELEECKILALEHHMSAKRLGFHNIYAPLREISNWQTSINDGTFPALRFFTQSVLPLAKAINDSDDFLISQILRGRSPLFSRQALKEAPDVVNQLEFIQSGVDSLANLLKEENPSCGAVLQCVEKHRLFDIPDSLKPILAILNAENSQEIEEDEKDSNSKEVKALMSFIKAPFKQIKTYHEYISGEASFDTHQGVKGLEFERVMVIMDDSEARGFNFGYGKLLGDKELSERDIKNKSEGKEDTIDRTRRLFYVTCSRTKESLSLVAYSENPEAVKTHVIENGWFEDDEIEMMT